MRQRVALVVCLLAAAAPSRAQAPYNIFSPPKNLATLFTGLYGPNGLVVDSEATLPNEQPHTAHFNSSFQSEFSLFTLALVNQFVTVPLPSPASGFTYQFDPSLGVFQRTTQSFGSIVAERAETIGAKRVSFGFSAQRFTFDNVEGIDLSHVPAVFTHDNAQLLGGRQDVVTTVNSITASTSQFTTFVTVGVSDRFDVSLAVPVISTSLMVVSDATIQRLGTTNPLTHFFRLSDGETVGNERIFTSAGSSSGIGDITVRLKSTLAHRGSSGFAAGVDVRLPTGDEMNLLGTGATGIQPFAIFSTSYGNVAPHANISYQWNGSSVLAGDPAAGTSASFPSQAQYAVGADVAANQHLTLAFDLLGRYVINAERLQPYEFHALDGVSVFPDITFSRESFQMLNGAIGAKVNVFGRFLVDANLLFSLNTAGVRDKVTPLIGFEYSF